MTGIRTAGTGVVLTLVLALLTVLTATGAGAATRVVLQPCGQGQCAAYKPHPLVIAEGPSLKLKHAHWKTWGKTARATGYLRGCDEGCSNLGNVTVVLHDVKRNYYYSKLQIIGGRNVAHYFYWSWKTHCFQGY